MRSVTKVAAGGGLGSALTIGALFAAGVFTGGAVVVADPLTEPAAAADGLVRFEDCDELLDWYVDHAIDEVGPYGWGGPVLYRGMELQSGRMSTGATADNLFSRDFAALSPSAKALQDGGQGNSETGTNTQEASVDEPDTVKTDGKQVVRLVGGNTLVITDVSGDRARELNRVTLPGQTYPTAELLLVGDRVVVVAGESWSRLPRFGPFERSLPPHGGDGTKVFEVDISDPAAPVLTHVDRYSGRLVAARQYDDTLRLVTQDGLPDLGWHQPGPGVSADEATRRNRELVRESTIEDWLPEVTAAGQSETLVDCEEVMHPRAWAGHGTAVVTTFGGTDVANRSAVGFTADAQLAYSSADRIYLAAAQSPDGATGAEDGDEPVVLRKAIPRTDLHAFALDGEKTTYAASGTIAGQVRDRWSLDSQDDVLRVAWTRQSSRGKDRNGLITMTEEDGRLVRIGEVRGLGVDEQIQSVRWFADFAVIVTFRRIDPLYAIDLSDPESPAARGELKVPGYSGYLHPIGEDRLLGLGVDADDRGRTRGAQAATFDVADLSDPDQLGKLLLGDGTELPALADPRGFTWLPDRRTGITSVSDWRRGDSRLIALRVADDGGLTLRDLMTVHGWQTRTLPLDDGRIAVIDVARRDDLRIIDLD